MASDRWRVLAGQVAILIAIVGAWEYLTGIKAISRTPGLYWIDPFFISRVEDRRGLPAPGRGLGAAEHLGHGMVRRAVQPLGLPGGDQHRLRGRAGAGAERA